MAEIIHINAEITGKCNQKCAYCFNDSGSHKKSFHKSLEWWIEIITHYRCKGLESILVTGGESFIRPEIMQLLTFAQNIGLRTSILSNGFRIARLVPTHTSLFRNLMVAQISLDSVNPDVHNLRRGNAKAWLDATSAIEALSQLGVAVEISAVVSEDTIGELPCLADYAIKTNCSLLIRPLAAIGRAKSAHLSNDFNEVLQNAVAKLKAETGVSIVHDRFLYAPVISDIDKVAYAKKIMTIKYNGEIRYSMLASSSALRADSKMQKLAA